MISCCVKFLILKFSINCFVKKDNKFMSLSDSNAYHVHKGMNLPPVSGLCVSSFGQAWNIPSAILSRNLGIPSTLCSSLSLVRKSMVSIPKM